MNTFNTIQGLLLKYGMMRRIEILPSRRVNTKQHKYKHLGLWEVKTGPPPKIRAAPARTDTFIDGSFSQLPVSDKWLYVDPIPLFAAIVIQ